VDERADKESVFEWYYAWQLTPAIIISPDLQVITNPGGTKMPATPSWAACVFGFCSRRGSMNG